jgi:hypothetical protein
MIVFPFVRDLSGTGEFAEGQDDKIYKGFSPPSFAFFLSLRFKDCEQAGKAPRSGRRTFV